jgi:hypothetical protein
MMMDASEAILGLGSHAAQDLLKLSGLDENSPMVGPEFTYFGVFLSALAYKEANDPSLNAGAVGLESLRSLYAQAEDSDTKMLDVVAGLSLSTYDEAVPVWPSTSERENVAITLCSLLSKLLKSSAQIELSVIQKAKLRAKVEDLFEVLEIAHREVRTANQSVAPALSDITIPISTKHSSSPIDEIQVAKSALFTQFDDGDITTKEYHEGLEELNQKELAIHLKMATRIYATSNLWDKKFAVVVAIAFLLGFLIGPWLYPKLFGYSSAEECVLNTKHKHAVGACYDLYPSIRK